GRGPRRDAQPGGLRPDAGGHRERPRGPGRPAPALRRDSHAGGPPDDQRAPLRAGAPVMRLRAGAPIVPLAFAGTEELYVGRRIASRILAPTSPRELLGEGWDGMLPPEGSRAELELARRLTARFEAVLGPAVEALYPGTVDPPGHPRRLRNRLTWLLLRPGR